jgi:16S rRNA G966 N2-methylase RsmD
LFLEKNPDAFRRLQEFALSVADAEVVALNSKLEDSVADITDFLRAGGSKSFPFIFIDPTGWTGFAMDVIEPLLRFDPGEVLINFMSGDIPRFVTSPQEQTAQSFMRLFGNKEFKTIVEGLSERDREDALVEEYRRIVALRGNFKFTCSAIVLHPKSNRTRFHLVYATRHPTGVKVFKEAEKIAMKEMEHVRGDVRQRKHEEATGAVLFDDLYHDPSYYEALRERYTQRAENAVLAMLRKRRRVSYDESWELAMSFPLTWESDLRKLLARLVNDKHLELAGMVPGQRVLQYGKGNILLWEPPSN